MARLFEQYPGPVTQYNYLTLSVIYSLLGRDIAETKTRTHIH